MLTGKLPFDASQPMDYLALQIRGTPIPLAKRIKGLKFPPGLEEVVMKTIAKDPDDRFPSRCGLCDGAGRLPGRGGT